MAPRRPPLRTVADDERPARPQTVTEAADAGDTRAMLAAMRTRIAKAVEDPNTPARDLAALTKRLVEVVRDIEAIDARAAQDSAKLEVVDDGVFDVLVI